MTRWTVSLASLATLAAIALGAWLGYRIPPGATPQLHPIAGRSMSPTLWGQHITIECEGCGFQWDVDPSIERKPDRVCPHCGHSVASARILKAHRPDQVSLQTASTFSMGQVVVVAKDDQLNAKRIVALAGDHVTVQENRLWVNGVRIDDALVRVPCPMEPARIMVDQDTRRATSRWNPQHEVTGWRRNPERSWVCNRTTTEDWLRYEHRSVYDQDRVGPILDDYPSNLDVQRALYPVDRISVSGIAIAEEPAQLVVAIWSAEQSRRITIDVNGTDRFDVSYHDGVAFDELPVTPDIPLAIRVVKGAVKLEQLRVSRGIDYRLRPRDDPQRYPLTVPDGHLFILGDNAPISIDSRDYGPVLIRDVVGVISRRVHDED